MTQHAQIRRVRPAYQRAFSTAAFLIAALLSAGCALVARMPTDGQPRAAATPAAAIPAPMASPAAGDRQGFAGLPSVSQIAAEVRPVVVSITTRSTSMRGFLAPDQEDGSGSGFIFDARGYIATNDHVIRDARNIRVTLPNGRAFDDVKVVGRDPRTDLAVLKIEAVPNLPVARIGDSDQLRVGDWVVAIGNALGLEGGPTVTAGVLGAVGRSIQEGNGVVLEDLLQTDAAINPGNSGGPLVDLGGRVVGINTAIDTRGQGIGFAISINGARAILEELIDKGRVVRGVMGINVATLTPTAAGRLGLPQTEGAIIVNIQNGSPADRAGLRASDVIARVDGREVKTMRDLLRYLATRKPGDAINLRVFRGRDERSITVTLEESR
ncbi:MAG: PDZ domain-containing protein [Dehalococcoidia bacterium]|nr:PDZ domain-containing protein [Dehalococcoidia bacterium]